MSDFEKFLEAFKAEEEYHAELVEGDHEYPLYRAWQAATARAAKVAREKKIAPFDVFGELRECSDEWNTACEECAKAIEEMK